jgi:hypothetical protein
MKSFLFGALAMLAVADAGAFSYPALDTTSHWSIQGFGFSPGQGFYVQGAGKNVWLAPGQPQFRTAFYNLAVVGAKRNGVEYKLQSQDYSGEMQGDGYVGKYGGFRVAQDVSLNVILYFMDDGRFEATTYFSGSGYSMSDRWDVIFRIDYDMAGAGNNIAEFLWNRGSEGKSVSPPVYPRREVLDGVLNYADGAGSGPAYWAASTHEIAVNYPAIAREAGMGAENAGFARILNAGAPRFGMVLWGSSYTPIQATFKSYASFNGTLDPGADLSTILQYTGEYGSYPRYAYAGRDQMAFVKLGAPTSGGTYQFGGKLFQRGSGRALSVSVHQHPPARLDGFSFDPDMVIRYTDKGGRTFRNALGELTGDDNLVVKTGDRGGVPYLPFDGYAQPGQSVTEAQLHNLMMATRDRTSQSMENVREWQVDLYLVDWLLQGDSGIWEAMFDYGGADANGIAREGAAVFWPALAGSGSDFQRRQSALSALRATGLALNLDPSWGICAFAGYCWNDGSACGGVRCGLSCPSGVSGCRYQAYNCAAECQDGSIMNFTNVNRNTIRFNSQLIKGVGFSELDWYRRAPEAWVKPGRFGIGSTSGPMPPFTAE